jgi:TolB-like protein/Flp pilus assembly protein TadD
VDEKADQYSFCAALFQGLYGVVPFNADNFGALVEQIRLRKVTEVPNLNSVPSSVYRALLRGLSPNPADRFSSMEALLEKLEQQRAVPRRRTVIVAGVVVLLAVAFLRYFVVHGDRKTEAATVSTGLSIAVLPFADMSPQKDQEYFADGVAEEILNSLAQIESLHVAGRTSSFSFKGKGDDARTIGRKLNVANLLEGSVRKEGTHARITAQLVNAADGFHLWSQTYDRELTGVFAAQDEIARAVVDALKLRLAPGRRRHEPTPEAYEQYLQGKTFFRRLNYENFVRAKAAYERAVRLDPDYAQAWAALATASYWVADGGESVAAISKGFDEAMSYAEKSVALDPDLADGYAARGFTRAAIGMDWEASRADFDRALKLNPSGAEVRRMYAQSVLATMGRLPEAVEEARRATEIDPLSALAWASLGRMYYVSGQLEAARIALEKSLQIAPVQNFAAAHLNYVFLLQKKPAEALEAAEKSTSDVFKLSGKALALHDLGRTAEAERVLGELIARHGHSGAFQIAEVYAWCGQLDKAFEWLDRAYVQRDGGLRAVKFSPLLRGLRGDPRYAALLAKMNLPPE